MEAAGAAGQLAPACTALGQTLRHEVEELIIKMYFEIMFVMSSPAATADITRPLRPRLVS